MYCASPATVSDSHCETDECMASQLHHLVATKLTHHLASPLWSHLWRGLDKRNIRPWNHGSLWWESFSTFIQLT